MKKGERSIVAKGTVVTIATRNEHDYISLSDMVRNFEGQGAPIEQWLKTKDTVLFLGVWEQLNNPGFNSLEFEGIRNEAGRNSFFLSAKGWAEKTGAIGVYASARRYGGTYAHPDIAFEFGSWHRPKWPSAHIGWRDEALQVVGGSPTVDELLAQLVRIVSTCADLDGTLLGRIRGQRVVNRTELGQWIAQPRGGDGGRCGEC